MDNFLNLDINTTKKSEPTNRLVKSEFAGDIKLQRVTINILSNNTKLTVIVPMTSKYSLGIMNLSSADIKNFPVLIPTDESLKSFIDYEIGWLFSNTEIYESDYKELKAIILGLIVKCLQKNITHLLTSYKLSDLESVKELIQNDENQ